ncbi:MAG TPA: hypothetical protein VJG32_00415 [Anaerolineae bacterium]|nr:hypothetical protein [Anaerolineae bacterium]
MEARKRTPEEKVKWLTQQLEEIRKAKGVMERFEKLTEKWLKKLQETK